MGRTRPNSPLKAHLPIMMEEPPPRVHSWVPQRLTQEVSHDVVQPMAASGSDQAPRMPNSAQSGPATRREDAQRDKGQRWSPTMLPDYEASDSKQGADVAAPNGVLRAPTNTEQIDGGDIVDWLITELPGRRRP
jgi:hypothetical protein